MLKPRFSWRSHAAALLATSPALFGLGAIRAQADDALPSQATPATTADYPKRADGKYDWQNSVDYDLLSPRLKEDFALMEKMQKDVYAKTYSQFNYSKDFIDFDLFIPGDVGSKMTGSRASLNYAKVACTTGVQLYRALKNDDDSSFFGNSKYYREFAIECMRVALYGKDETMRKACIAFVEDYASFVTEMKINTKHSDPLSFLMFSDVKNSWNNARIRVGHDGANYSTKTYTAEDREKSANTIFRSIMKRQGNLSELAVFYRDYANSCLLGGEANIVNLLRADVIEDAIKLEQKRKLEKPELNVKVENSATL